MVNLQDHAKEIRQRLADERARIIRALLLKAIPEDMLDYLIKNPKMGYVVAAGQGHYVREIHGPDPRIITYQLVKGDSRHALVNNQFAGKVVAESVLDFGELAKEYM